MVGVLQSKTQLYAASKRPVSAQQKNRCKRKDGKWYSKQMAPKRRLCAILVSDKVDFRPKKGNERQRWTLYNDKGGESSGRHNSY